MLPAGNEGGEGHPILIDSDDEAGGSDDNEIGHGSQFKAEDVGATGQADDDHNVNGDIYDDADRDGEGGAAEVTSRTHEDDDVDPNGGEGEFSSSCTTLRPPIISGVEDDMECSQTKLAARNSAATATAGNAKKWEEIESMDEITKSPYEAPECAEVGESWFERLKEVLTPVIVDGEENANPELIRPCGDKLAISIFTAHQQIGKSGVLYSPTWVEGKIRGVECGWLPKKQLLVCLHEHRFLKAEERVLQAIVHNLQTSKMVKMALKSWALKESFLNLSVANIFAYNKRKSDCYKCEIFVARAFAINDILRIDSTLPDDSLMKKIKACLSIMSQHVKANPQKLAQRQQALEERKKRRAKAGAKTTGMEPNSSESEDQAPSQGRTTGPLREISVTMEIASGGSGSEANESAVTADSPLERTSRGASRGDRKREREERQESTLVLLGIVQEQHARMGQTIEFLRSRIQENIDFTRAEIQEETIDERTEKRSCTNDPRKNGKGPFKR